MVARTATKHTIRLATRPPTSPVSRPSGLRNLLLAILLCAPAEPLAAIAITIDAPASLDATVGRLRNLDQRPLTDALARAGLEPPARIRVALIPEGDPRARARPDWVVGWALAPEDIGIFPSRIVSYPYESLEAVLWHEIVHLALTARAQGRALPRWFHEGVAVSVEAGWRMTDQVRLLAAMLEDPAIADVERLFVSDAQQDTTRAYLLAAALIADIRERHGAAVPGAIAGRVGAGVPFAEAFRLETGELPAAAASRAWASYRRWTNWLLAITSGSTVWLMILALAAMAFIARRRRNAARRRRWETEEMSEGDEPGPYDADA